MRVLVVANDFPHPNAPQAGIFVLRQIEELRKLGWEARVIRLIPWAPPLLPRWKSYADIPRNYEYAGVQVAVTRVVLLPRFGLMESIGAQTQSFVRGEAVRFNPDVIHAHQIIPTGLMAVDHGYPVIVTAHGSDAYDYPYRSRGFRRAAARVLISADKVVAVSRFIASHAENLGARDIDVVFNGADPEVFFPVSRVLARAKLSIADDRHVVVYAGYLGEAKGIFELVAALRSLHDLNPLLLVAGTGEGYEAMQQLLRQHGIDHRFCGVVKQEYLAEMIGASDVVTLPSHREGLPTVICEAMLAGRSVVATSVGGIPEILSDHETGLIVPPEKPLMLSEALREVLTIDSLKKAIEHKAHEFALLRLTWLTNAATYDRIFRGLVKGTNSARVSERAV